MKRLLAAVALTLLALTGCDSSQSGGASNPDNQVDQPPLPGESADAE